MKKVFVGRQAEALLRLKWDGYGESSTYQTRRNEVHIACPSHKSFCGVEFVFNIEFRRDSVTFHVLT